MGGHFTWRVEGEQSAQVGNGEMAEQWRKMGTEGNVAKTEGQVHL